FFSLRETGSRRSLVRLRGTNSNFVGRFELSAPVVQIWETNGVATITIYRHGGSPAVASVRVAASAGTASNGVDFVFAPTLVTFAVGETSKTVDVVIVHEALVEPPEDLTITLSDPLGAILGGQISETLTILDHPGGLVDESFCRGLGQNNWIGLMASLPEEK